MSLKPLILIFQETVQPSVTPAIPDLNTVIVGPAYDVLDYPDDGDTILLSSVYGSLESDTTYTPPATGTDAITVLNGAYPQQSSGSQVDHSSVRLTLRTPRVILGSTYLSSDIAPVLGTHVTTSSGDRTLITLVGVVTNLITAGVQPGDRIIITSSAGTQTAVRVVASIGEPNADALVPGGNEIYLRTTAQLPAAGAGVDAWTYDSLGECRIERALSTQALSDPHQTLVLFPEPGSDKLTLRGGVTVSLTLTPRPTVSVPSPTSSVVTRALSYASVYLGYRALRQDLQGLRSVLPTAETSVNGIPTITGIGKIDARNPLAVGVKLALNNAGNVPIYYYGVSSNDSTGYANARSRLSTRNELYCFVPMTQDINVLGAFKAAFEQSSSPLYARDHGVMQRFRIVLGSVPLPTAQTIYSGSISGVSSAVGSMVTGKYRTLVLDSASTGSVGVRSVLPGDSITIGLSSTGSAAWQSRRGTHAIGHANSSKDYPNSGDPSSLEVVPASSRWDDTGGATSADIEFVVRAPDGTVKLSQLSSVAVSTITGGGDTGTITYTMLAPTVTGGPYTVTYVLGSALSISVVGFNIIITVGPATTHTQVAAAVNAHSLLSLLMTATVSVGGAFVVTPSSQSTRTSVSGQTGAAATLAAFDASHTTVSVLTGMTSASVGRYLTISGSAGGNNGTFLITTYNSATSVNIYTPAPGTLPDAGPLGWVERYAYCSILPVVGSATATVVVNDALFNQIDDDSASFLTAGVLAGDIVEFPLDPNNYGPTAFDGRTLLYRVSTVMNENRLRIVNGLDDDASTARELPHYFCRDLQDRFIDDTTPNALSYRVRRILTPGDRILALVATAQSVRSKRLTLMWPDIVGVSDLRDGSLPRTLSTVRTLAGLLPSYYLACAVGGVIAGIPAQMGLTGGSFVGIDRLQNTTDVFEEEQLSDLNDGGFFLCTQAAEGALPVCEHQLTTDPSSLETGELSVVKNIDFISIFFRDLLKSFLGQYNNTAEAINEIYRAVSDNTELLKGRVIAKLGPPLLSGTITSLAPSTVSGDTVELFYDATVPRPLNNIGFHLVVQR